MRQMHNAVPGLQVVCTCGHMWRDVCAADHARANKRGQYARLMRNVTKLGMVKSPFNYGLFVLIRPISFNQSNDRGKCVYRGGKNENFFIYIDIYFVILYFFFYFILDLSLIPFIFRKNYIFVLLTWFDEISMKISNFAIRYFDILLYDLYFIRIFFFFFFLFGV